VLLSKNTRKVKFCACWYVYRLANIFAWCLLFDAAHTTTGSTNYQTTYCNSYSTILSCFNLGLTIHLKIRQNRSDWHPNTNPLHEGSEAFHRTMSVWLLHHQSYISCITTFVTNHGVESALNDLVPKWQIQFLFFESIQSFSIF